MARIIWVFIVAIIGMTGCGAPASQEGQGAATSETTEESSSSNAYSPALDVDTLLAGIPVFSSYDHIAPLFQQDQAKTYVINFWATWCKPCVKELPYFEQLHANLKDQGIEVVLVSLDFPKDLEKKLVPFVQERQLQSDVLVLLDGDYNSWIDKVSPEWSGAIPATMVYNSKNRKFHGEEFSTYEELETLVKSVL